MQYQRDVNQENAKRPIDGLALIRRMFQGETDRLNKKLGISGIHNGKKSDSWACIHFDLPRFHSAVSEAVKFVDNPTGRYNTVKFLDVGCGLGQKVYLATIMGMDAEGLDFMAEYVKKAKELIDFYSELEYWSAHHKDLIFRANALTFKRYAQYDMIYFYRPIAEQNGQMKLEKRILKTAKVGAVAVVVYAPVLFVPEEAEKYGWIRVADATWKRIQEGPIKKGQKLMYARHRGEEWFN
jgi:SAM-dependent methyltransferase